MKKTYNFLLAVIFSFTIIITSFSLTVMSKRLQLKTINMRKQMWIRIL